MSYQTLLKNHLGEYKTNSLGIEEEGYWRDKPYPHILPKEQYRQNILGTIRDEFWDYFETQDALKMHRYFYHLTSSQAMCYNLFYPFLMDNNRHLDLLLGTIGLPKSGVSEASFGKVLDKPEGTKFDFYIGYENGMQILFDVKLQESGFGSARNNEERNKKFKRVYKKRMRKIISNRFQNPSVFFKYYQLIRNLTYLGHGDKTHLFFIVPFENKALETKTSELIHFLLEGKYEDRVNIQFLENIVLALVEQCETAGVDLLKKHFDLFTAKYGITSKGAAKVKKPYT